MESMHHGLDGGSAFISLHDPMCVWYSLTANVQRQEWQVNRHEDIRIETTGQWTRGMCVIDRRGRKMRDDDSDEEAAEVPGDSGGWLGKSSGNRIGRCIATPGELLLAQFLLNSIFP